MAFSRYSDHPQLPRLALQEVLHRAQRALMPLREDAAVAWQRGAPHFYPAADGSGQWDVFLGPIWTLNGDGEHALRAELGDDLGSVLTETFDDFRLPSDGAERLAGSGRTDAVERFLYTGSDVALAIGAYRGRPFLMIDHNGHASIIYPKRLVTRVRDSDALRNEFPTVGVLAFLEGETPAGTSVIQELISVHALAPLRDPMPSAFPTLYRSADLWLLEGDTDRARTQHALLVDVNGSDELRKLIAQASVGLRGFRVINPDAACIELAVAGGDMHIEQPDNVGIGGTLRVWRVVPQGNALVLVVDNQAPLLQIARLFDVAPQRPYGIRFALAREELSPDSVAHTVATVQEQIYSRRPALTLDRVRYVVHENGASQNRYSCGLPGGR